MKLDYFHFQIGRSQFNATWTWQWICFWKHNMIIIASGFSAHESMWRERRPDDWFFLLPQLLVGKVIFSPQNSIFFRKIQSSFHFQLSDELKKKLLYVMLQYNVSNWNILKLAPIIFFSDSDVEKKCCNFIIFFLESDSGCCCFLEHYSFFRESCQKMASEKKWWKFYYY